ncbi:lymphocyte antigen 6D [Entelurus aequoreus]|uniref:lymphocyte antigen 6D n=1 Tax=Entelurus aequoreus TaxID=161455 RepID=UPI002B1D0F6A|nr:lymphocyte antigen 6D [Entelurus aequoreus]
MPHKTHTFFENMKVLLVTLMLLLLCSTPVLTLKCYTCHGDDEDNCITQTECPQDWTFCRTFYDGNQLHRECVEDCDDTLPFTSCCTEDLC